MAEHYPFQKQPLPYDYIALMPQCDPDTLYTHHISLYSRYVDTLNALLRPLPQYHGWTLEQLMLLELQVPVTLSNQIKFNAGGVYTHNHYFQGMGKSQPTMTNQLVKRLVELYGSLEQVRELMKQAAQYVLGSGWVWLISERNNHLHIVISQNYEVPSLHLFQPILALDVWEHAYFAHYPARLAAYADAWFSIINWRDAEQRYLAPLAASAAQ